MPKEKAKKDKQRSGKHTYQTKDRVTRTPLKTAGELRCSGRVSSSCSTSDIRRVNLVTHPVISREWGKNREVFTTSETYPWSFVTQIPQHGQPSHGGGQSDQHRAFATMWGVPDNMLHGFFNINALFGSDYFVLISLHNLVGTLLYSHSPLFAKGGIYYLAIFPPIQVKGKYFSGGNG
jgi:hypothetical protein